MSYIDFCSFVIKCNFEKFFDVLCQAEELAAGGDAKFHHLNLPLHVRVTSVSSLDQVSRLKS